MPVQKILETYWMHHTHIYIYIYIYMWCIIKCGSILYKDCLDFYLFSLSLVIFKSMIKMLFSLKNLGFENICFWHLNIKALLYLFDNVLFTRVFKFGFKIKPNLGNLVWQDEKQGKKVKKNLVSDFVFPSILPMLVYQWMNYC